MLQFSLKPVFKPVLVRIQNAFGGSVYPRVTQSSNYSSGGFEVASKLVSYFEKHKLYFRHRRLYVLWWEAYRIVALKDHLTHAGMERLQILQKQASALRPKKSRPCLA